MSSKASKWTKEAVEWLWETMGKLQGQRDRGRMEAWWALVATHMNDATSLGVTGKSCANKAAEVHRAGRPYPWEVSRYATREDIGAQLQEVLTRLQRIEDKLDT